MVPRVEHPCPAVSASRGARDLTPPSPDLPCTSSTKAASHRHSVFDLKNKIKIKWVINKNFLIKNNIDKHDIYYTYEYDIDISFSAEHLLLTFRDERIRKKTVMTVCNKYMECIYRCMTEFFLCLFICHQD